MVFPVFFLAEQSVGAGQGVKFVKDDLDFDNADSDVSVFELTIRGLAPERR